MGDLHFTTLHFVVALDPTSSGFIQAKSYPFHYLFDGFTLSMASLRLMDAPIYTHTGTGPQKHHTGLNTNKPTGI